MMSPSSAESFLVSEVRESTRSLTPTELTASLAKHLCMTRRKAKTCLSHCVDNNLLAYRQVLGRTVVVLSLNRYHDLAPGVVLAPPHLPPLTDGTHCIIMKEGISFGNGTHPTTRLCAEMMVKNDVSGGRTGRALDLGTGTGVLALLAIKRGCEQVDATEIDPIAMHDARENARLNGCLDHMTVHHADGFKPLCRYPLITANLRYPTLIALEEQIRGWMECSGDLILSGIKDGEEEKVKAVYKAHFELKQQKSHKGWVVLHYKKANS